MATTPPSQPLVHTPPTPLHGAKYDSIRPYITRKSTRHSKRWTQRDAQTPPPQSFNSESGTASVSEQQPRSPEVSARHAISPPPSTQNSPQEKGSRSGRALRSTVSSAMFHAPFASLEPSSDSSKPLSDQQLSVTMGTSMLPTPAKTPRKKRAPAPALASTARVLFSVRPETVEDAMPMARKRGRKKRYVGFSLDSAEEDDSAHPDGNIQIFTDSKERVPELDFSEDNPFVDNPFRSDSSRLQSTPKGSSRKMANDLINNNPEETEAFQRGEGMLYVFRGKKIFRRFADDEESNIPSPVRNSSQVTEEPSPRLRPFTRSSIKPRLLFPTAAQRQERGLPIDEDEEAITDIEELPPLPNDSEMTDVGPEETEEEEAPAVTTPVNRSFSTPATPPATGRATRSSTKKAELGYSSPAGPEPQSDPEPLETPEAPEPVPRKRGKKLSPFDGWQRIKASSSSTTTSSGPSKGKKRGGDGLEKGTGAAAGGSKRIKGGWEE